MKLAYHSSTSWNSDLPTDIKASAKAGFKALEMHLNKMDAHLKKGAAQEIKELLEEHRIEPATFNSIEFIAFRGDEYKKIQERCHQGSEYCKAVGCPVVTLVPSPVPDWQMPWDELVDEYVTVLRDLADIAARLGVRVSFEFLGFGWCSPRTPRGAYEIVKKTDRANLTMIIDCMHYYAGGGLLGELDAIDPKLIESFHINDVEDVPKEAITDPTRLLPGLGVIPLDDYCKRLAATGYDGFCAVELFRPEYYEWDPYVLADKSYKHAVKILSRHFTIE